MRGGTSESTACSWRHSRLVLLGCQCKGASAESGGSQAKGLCYHLRAKGPIKEFKQWLDSAASDRLQIALAATGIIQGQAFKDNI